MNKLSSSGTKTPSPVLVAALRRILYPLVKLLQANSITYPFLSNLLKSIYVEVAEKEFSLQGKLQTDSRISLLSGVHRKDVKRLRSEDPREKIASPTVSMGARLVALWTTNPLFLDEAGQHKPLPRQISEGGEASFEGLVGLVSKDMRSRVVLDEWLRIGAARLDEEGRVCLNTDAFVPEAGFDEKAFFFGQNLRDHVSAAAHNLQGLKPPFLERSVYYNNLTEESVLELADLSRKHGMQALHAVNRHALALQEKDEGKPGASLRMNFGIYFLSTGNEDTSD